jgi:predicted extracellular nuclease
MNISTRLSGLLIFLLACGQMCPAQLADPAPREALRVAFYNVENLFDAHDDSLKRDEAYLPESPRHWDQWKYQEKINKTAKVLRRLSEWEPAGIIGLVEIENRGVLEKLRYSDPLRTAQYEVIHYPSPDERGIDVGALYQPAKLSLLHSRAVPVNLAGGDKTRDILVISLRWKKTGDTLHLLFCHWPSRYGGRLKSAPKRVKAAQTVRRLVDSLRSRYKQARLLIMGDFNDTWGDESLYTHLGARADSTGALRSGSRLVNLSARQEPQLGTHRYRGEWAYLDQAIVSLNLLGSRDIHLKDGQMEVLRASFLLEQDPKYPGQRPYRAYLGMKAHGGYSDHLPIYVDLLPGAAP